MTSAKKTTNPDFEKLLGELDKIVQRMEQGEQSLDKTMKDFERGMELSAQCQASLDQAQQRVDKLVKKHGDFALEPMDADDREDQSDDGEEV